MKYDSHNNVILNVFSLKDEVYELRDQHKHMLGGSSESLSLMYSSLLRKYEARKEECDKIARAHTEAVTQAEQYQDQLNQYKSSYENMVKERNKYKQQCTQVNSGIFFKTSLMFLSLLGDSTMGSRTGGEKSNED